MHDYIRDGDEIYRRSFATIRAEADLSAFSDDVAQVVVRMIHACGEVNLAQSIASTADVVAKGRAALRAGAPILCDATMVASGITRRRLPADNEVICTLNAPDVPEMARERGTTRTAAAVDLWVDHLDGAVVAIGNAPTALFRLMELIQQALRARPRSWVGPWASSAPRSRRTISSPPVSASTTCSSSAAAVAAPSPRPPSMPLRRNANERQALGCRYRPG